MYLYIYYILKLGCETHFPSKTLGGIPYILSQNLMSVTSCWLESWGNELTYPSLGRIGKSSTQKRSFKRGYDVSFQVCSNPPKTRLLQISTPNVCFFLAWKESQSLKEEPLSGMRSFKLTICWGFDSVNYLPKKSWLGSPKTKQRWIHFILWGCVPPIQTQTVLLS